MCNISATKFETTYWSPRGKCFPMIPYVNEVVREVLYHAFEAFPISEGRAIVLVGNFGKPRHWRENLSNSLVVERKPESLLVLEVPVSIRLGRLRRESLVKTEASELLAMLPAVAVTSSGKTTDISAVIDLWKVVRFASQVLVRDKAYWISALQERTYKGGHGGGRGDGHYNRDCGKGFEELKAEKPFCREYSNGNSVDLRILLRKDGIDGVVIEPVIGEKEDESTGFSPSVILTTDEFFESVEGNVIRIKKGVGIAVPHRKDGSMGRRAFAALGVEE